ncbi:MAG: hypothetical protein ABEJ66_02370, partial [Candidatus Nanohaloarchaea archaeon]
MKKGQINLEFMAAAFIYISAHGALFMASQNAMPSFTASAGEASLNLEARQVSSKLLNTPGRQDFTGGTNWQKNSTTIDHTTSVGLASSFKHIEREKIMALRTVDPLRGGRNYLNYSQFKRVTNADHQYRFTFTWMPVIETPESFTRGEGGKLSPPILEPETAYYSSAGNEIHYGTHLLNGTTYHFLVTSHDGVYNTTYISLDWDFRNHAPHGTGDSFGPSGDAFNVTAFQNRQEEPGAM